MFTKVVKTQTPLASLMAQMNGRYAYDRYSVVAEDERGVIGVDGKIAHNQTERFVSTCEMRIFEVDDHASIIGWVPQESSGHFVLGSSCVAEQAPETVKALWRAVARRVVYQIALSSDLDDDAALLARWLTGVNLLNPIERMSCIADGSA